MRIEFEKGLNWSSDWNGCECGFDSIPVIGLYTTINQDGKTLNLYIDTETGKIVDFWMDEDEEDD